MKNDRKNIPSMPKCRFGYGHCDFKLFNILVNTCWLNNYQLKHTWTNWCQEKHCDNPPSIIGNKCCLNVAQSYFSKNARSKLFNAASTIIIRCLHPKLSYFEFSSFYKLSHDHFLKWKFSISCLKILKFQNNLILNLKIVW